MDNNGSWTNSSTNGKNVSSTHGEDYGRTDVVERRIPTLNVKLIRERFRPMPLPLIRKYIVY